MAEDRKPTISISQTQFYIACRALEKNKDKFFSTRPTLTDAAKMISEIVGFAIAETTVRNLRNATNIHWEPKRAPANPRSVKSNAPRTLAVALVRIYKKLGEEVPQNLQQLYDEFNRNPPPIDNTITTNPQ